MGSAPGPGVDAWRGGTAAPYDGAGLRAALRLFRTLEWLVGDPREQSGRVALARVLQRRVPPLDLRPAFGPLPEQLQGLLPALSEAEAEAEAVVSALGALGSGGDAPEGGLAELAGAHAALAGMLAAGLRNDASDAAIIVRQRCRAAELALEDEVALRLAAVRRRAEGGEEGDVGASADSVRRGLSCGLLVLGGGGFRPVECASLAGTLSNAAGPLGRELAVRAAGEAGALREALSAALAAGDSSPAEAPAAAAAVEASLARQVELLALVCSA